MGPITTRSSLNRLRLAFAAGACMLAGSGALATAATASHGDAAAAPRVSHLTQFLSADRQVWCTVGGMTNPMFCGTGGAASSNPNPPQTSAILGRAGNVTLCRVAAASQRSACVQNWNADAPVLALGRQNQIDNILCTSATSGITCVFASGPDRGRGFLISATTVKRVGPTGPPAPVPPVLGDTVAGAAGFGVAHPRLIAEGNNPLTEVGSIRWRNWGAKQATGTGTGYWLPPGSVAFSQSRPAPANIVAFDLGTCHGQRAYLKEEHWIPSHGGRFSPRNAYPTCL